MRKWQEVQALLRLIEGSRDSRGTERTGICHHRIVNERVLQSVPQAPRRCCRLRLEGRYPRMLAELFMNPERGRFSAYPWSGSRGEDQSMLDQLQKQTEPREKVTTLDGVWVTFGI